MTAAESERRGFFAYYREYAKSGVHAASAAALTALIGIASFTGVRWFVLVAIAVYVLPPVFLYFTGEGERVPSVVGEGGESNDGRGSGRGEGDRRDNRSSDAAESRVSQREQRLDGDDHDRETKADVGSNDVGSAATAGPTNERGSETTGADDESESESEDEDEPTDEDETAPDVEPGWKTANAPTEESLLDVVATADGAYAVGENGVVLAREDDGWAIAVEGGPTANGNPLRGVDATADGGAVWFAGDSGVLGRYRDGELTDHSAPEDRTSTWTDVAVTGTAGDERVHLVNGSGELLRGRYDDGRVSWGGVEKPGSGSSISAVSFVDDDRGHLCDTSQGVYGTTDGGESYERVGIDDANAAFTGVDAAGSTVVVSCDDGAVFRYDGSVWTRLHAAETELSAIDLAGESGLAAGDAGTVVELVDGGWETVEAPVDADLSGVTIGQSGSDGSDIAVGTDGTVIER
ncbi:hypothetical protein [Halococcus sp. IIIV-5B]|uniref:sialidase family protein n=1 Tax=Halococcus sp. IIIV-5B TaxID=2321230 RepID=UPI000E743669|nr:hypothetical protein [Halococcus sp. IIIV-5B]RJT03899.1 hypothetical protein D3261_10710 [Halococcus sp. IIIV-5B]